ncbi:FAD-dependent monooxygenase [Longispora sp. NPDC051575]|uniref:FAD-dependent monooxygenase n=1 Tax=Longispora sp. NPDC051575 TaxID=3154943 RepID=UPI00341922B5
MSTNESLAFTVPVLIVGAGPVGSVLALELAHHGVPSMVIDRAVGPSKHPKMDYINGRSMELLHRLGVADEVRAGGIGPEHNANFVWTRGFDQPTVATWEHASVDEWVERYAQVNDGSAPTQPYQRVQGSLLEGILRERATGHPLVDVRDGWTFTELYQDDTGVVATVVDSTTNTWHTIRARYLVACDGGSSTVRQFLGIGADNNGPRTQFVSVYFKSSDPVLRSHGRGFVTVEASGVTLVSRDERDTWTASLRLFEGETLTEDPVELVQRRLGVRIAIDEVLSIAQWEGALAVAATYRRGSVFLAGDSAHQFYPTGGHGANTGLGDAVDLGWKLGAVVNGWAGPKLLDSYEAERRPVALFNREMCANLLEVWRRFAQLARDGASSEHIAGFLAEETHQGDNGGIHFGYRYVDSPVICAEDGPAPIWRWRELVPTTWPGGRAPSLRLADGSNVFDHLGPELTLVDTSGDGEPLVRRAAERGIPVRYLRIDDDTVAKVWERALVLVRPDQHVCWRADEAPADWNAVLDRVVGGAR